MLGIFDGARKSLISDMTEQLVEITLGTFYSLSMIQDIFIIGATGKVGRSLVRQIVEKRDMNSQLHANPTRIVGLASSQYFVYSANGLENSQMHNFIVRDYNGAELYPNPKKLIDIAKIGTEKEASSLVFVDVTAANEPMMQLHLKVINDTPYGIVTANKNPIAFSPYDVFQTLTKNPRRYGYRCSVMAGSDAIPFLQDLGDLNDNLRHIEGCFSGTLGYITSELENGRMFSEILQEALQKGYTEPDPRDDLNGLDVSRKLIVLARSAGFNVSMKDAVVNPFIPLDYFNNETAESFMQASKQLDKLFANKMISAKRSGKTLRYVASIDIGSQKPKIEVSLKEVQSDSELGRLRGTMNKIIITSETYSADAPYIIQSPGAGLEITARNVRRDLMSLLPKREMLDHNTKK